MLRGLPVGNPVLDKHVAGKIPLRLEGAARRAADCGPLPWLRDLAVGDVAQVSKNLALVTESAHASMLRHLPLAHGGRSRREVRLQLAHHRLLLARHYLVIPIH